MASPAAVLSILVDANTSSASAKLVEYQAQLDRIDARARRGIETRLGAEFNPRGFAAYQAATDKAIAKARDKAAFKAELGANYSPAGFTAYQRAVDKANLSTREASRSQVALGSAVDRGRGHLMGMASVAAGASLGIAYLGKASVDTAVTFQRSMEQVHTQAGASQAQVDALSKAVERLGPAVGTGPKDLADGMYHVVSSLNATLPPAQRMTKEMEALKIAAEGAKVGNANLVDVTNALDAAIVSGIGGAQDMGKAMGALNAIVGAGDMHMQDLADAFSTGLLGPMKNFGVSLKDIGGALAVFGDNNIRGQEAATKLNSAIRIMAAPSKAAAKELGGIGITATQLADDIRNKGLVVALEDLKQHLVDSGQTASQQARTLAIAFGGRQSTGVQLLIGQMDRLKAKTAEVGDGANRFGSDWAATQKTMAFQTGQLSAELQTLGLKVGAALAPVIPVLVTMAGKLGVFVSQMQSGQGAGGQFASAMKTAFGIVKTAATDVLDVFGGIKGTIEAIAVGYAATKLLSIARSFQALGSGLRSVSGSGIAGSTAAAAAGADSAAVGGARGALGKVASGLGGVMRFAGWAAFAAPLGIALTNVVGKWVDANAPTDGKRWADRFVKGMPDISEQLRVKLGRAADRALTQPLANARSEIARAVSAGAAPPVRGRVPQRDLKPTSAERQATIAAWFDQGWESGKAVVRGLQSVKDVSTPIVMQTFLEKLRQLPARAQPEAAKVMVNFATGLQQTGKISMRALQSILTSLEGQIPGFSAYLQSQGMVTAREFADTLKFTQATDTLKKTLKGMSSQFGFTQAGIKITTGDMNTDVTRAMTEMRKIIAGSSGNARKDAIAEFDKLKAGVSGRLSAMGHDVATKSGQMRDDIANNTHGAWKSASSNMGNFAAAVASAINSGAVGTGQGMNILISNLNKALKEMGQKQLSPVQVGAMTLSIGKQKQLQSFAHGGLMQVGRPGEAGRDTVPLNVGGQNIVVGAGEQVAVFTRHQQHVANRALAPMGGLPGLFSKVSRPNYMAAGGYVDPIPGFSLGRTDMGVDANAAVGTPIQAIGDSKLVSVLQNWYQGQPLLDFQLMSGPDAGRFWYVAEQIAPITEKIGAMFKAGQAVGHYAPSGTGIEIGWASNASGATLAQGTSGYSEGQATRAGQSFRDFITGLAHGKLMAGGGASFAKLSAPLVHGGGVIGQIAKAAVALATSDANKYLEAHAPTSGSPGGPVPAGTVREWLTQALQITNHFSPANLSALYGRTIQESGGNPRSINLWDSNAKAGHPSKGLLQTIDSTFSQYELPGHGDIWNPVDNAIAAIRYMFARYHHIVGASGSGYAKGGIIPKFAGAFANGGAVTANGPTMAMFGENGPETAVFLPHFARGGPVGASLTGLHAVSSSGHHAHGGGGGRGRATAARSLGLIQQITGEPALPNVGGKTPTAPAGITGLAGNIAGIRTQIDGLEHQYGIIDSFYSLSTDSLVDQTTGELNEPAIHKRLGQLANLINVRRQIFGAWGRVVVFSRRLVSAYQAMIARMQATVKANKAMIVRLQSAVAAVNKSLANSKLKGSARKSAQKHRDDLNQAIQKYEKADSGLSTHISNYQGKLASAVGDVATAGDSRDSAWVSLLQEQQERTSVAATQASPIVSAGADTSGAAVSAGGVDTSALLQTLLTQSQQSLAVSQAQYSVLQGMPAYGGSFATGGVVPGPFGAPRTIIAHGGEMVGGPQGATEVHWHVANGMEWLKQFVQVEIKQGGRRTQRFAARQLPGGR